jgi:hypothetical protein
MREHVQALQQARTPDIPVDWQRCGVLLAAVLGTALA